MDAWRLIAGPPPLQRRRCEARGANAIEGSFGDRGLNGKMRRSRPRECNQPSMR